MALRKALAWNKELHESLLQMGFKCCKSDAGIYVLKDKEGLVIFIIYVDDAAMMGNKASLVQKQKAIFMK